MGEEGFVNVEKDGEDGEEKDVNGGEVELEEKESEGSETVVKEEKAEVELIAEEEKVEGDEGKCVAEENDCVEGADAKVEENREDVWDGIGELGVGIEEEEEEEEKEEEGRVIDEDKDAGSGCLNVNVESVEGTADNCDWSLLENEE